MNPLYEEELRRIGIGRSLSERFLEELEGRLNKGLDTLRIRCERQEDRMADGIGRTLAPILDTLYIRFCKSCDMGMNGPLRYLYLSFLRTSVLDGPAYRIDLYDREGRSSKMKCTQEWGCQEVFQGFYGIKEDAVKFFRSQRRVREYILELRLMEVALEVHVIAKPYIAETVRNLAAEARPWAKECPECRIGEFLDRSERIEVKYI